MVTSVFLGNLFSVNNRQVFGGGASGLDTESIVTALVEAKKVPLTALEDKVDKNTKIISAYGQLRSILDKFKTAVDSIRNPEGVLNAAQNSFKYRTTSLSSSTATSAETFISASAAPGAALGKIDVTITDIAQEKVVAYSTPFTSRTASSGALIAAGTITLDSTNTDPVDIDISAGESLNNIVAKINAVKDQTNVEASVVQVSTTDYRLVIRSTKTGLDNAYTLTDPSGVFAGLTVDAPASQSALDADFTVNGISMTRSENTVTDVIDNLTINLKQATAGAVATIQVSADTGTAKNGIIEFVNAYNEFKVFAELETAINEDGTPTEDADFVANEVLRNIIFKIDNELTRTVSGIASSELRSIQDLGITFTDYAGDDENPAVKNVLTVDESKLDSYLASSFDQVRKVFEFNLNSDSADLQIFKRNNNVSATAFKLVIDTVAGTAVAQDPDTLAQIGTFTYDDSSGSIFLTGDSGDVEGLQLIYNGAASTTINVTLTQGIADRLYNYISSAIEPISGVIDIDIGSIETENTRLEEDIADLNAQIEKYQDALLAKFAALEQSISAVNQLLSALNSQDLARQNA